MPRSITYIAQDMREILPDGFYTRVEPMSDKIWISDGSVAFAITRAQIDDNLHLKALRDGLKAHFNVEPSYV